MLPRWFLILLGLCVVSFCARSRAASYPLCDWSLVYKLKKSFPIVLSFTDVNASFKIALQHSMVTSSVDWSFLFWTIFRRNSTQCPCFEETCFSKVFCITDAIALHCVLQDRFGVCMSSCLNLSWNWRETGSSNHPFLGVFGAELTTCCEFTGHLLV